MKKLITIVIVVLLVAMLAGTVSAKRPPGPGPGARKTGLYNSSGYDCTTGATDLSDGPYGFVVMNINADGMLIVEVSLKRAMPYATYDIYVNQEPGACPLEEATAPGALRTNRRGNGNAHIELPRVEGATYFWVSAATEGQTLRSTAVELD